LSVVRWKSELQDFRTDERECMPGGGGQPLVTQI